LTKEAINDQAILTHIENLLTPQHSLVDYIPQEEIERISEAIREKIAYTGGEVLIDEVCNWQSRESGLSVMTEIAPTGRALAERILGRIKFEPLEICIYEYSDGNDARQKFTLAHELGHHFLGHSKYMAGEYCEEDDFELDQSTDLSLKDIRRMEWQANYFASCLLLPKNTFTPDFLTLTQARGLSNRGFGILFVEDQRCNQENYYAVTNSLKFKYKVSRSVVKVRLERLGLLNDKRTSLKRIGR
jgi:Zn-dependent peptidase ImmA (M78 family)